MLVLAAVFGLAAHLHAQDPDVRQGLAGSASATAGVHAGPAAAAQDEDVDGDRSAATGGTDNAAEASDDSAEADDSGDSPTAEDRAAERAGEQAMQKGLALERDKRYPEAVQAYRAALEADPDLAKAERQLGRCYGLLGWKDQALEHLQAYLDSGEEDPQAAAYVDGLLAQQAAFGTLPEGPALAVAGPFSLRGDLGWGWGLSSSDFGHRFNRTNNSNPFTYTYEPGQGLAWTLEPLLELSPALALGLSCSSLYLDDTGGATDTSAGTTTTDSTNARELAVPVLLTVHARARLARHLLLECFAGAGGIFTQPFVETSTDTITTGASETFQTVRYQRDIAPDLAFRGGISLDWILSPTCRIFAQASFLQARQPAESVMYSSTITNAKGAVVYSATDSSTYVVDPPSAQSVAPPSVPATISSGLPAAGQVKKVAYSYDNGPTQWTEVVTYDHQGAQTDAVFTEDNVLGSTVNGDTVKVLAATAGLAWSF
jgi:hypothetical protein